MKSIHSRGDADLSESLAELSHSLVEPLLPILDDAPQLVKRVAAITSSSVADVTQRLLREHEVLGQNVNAEFAQLGQRRGVWTDELVAFYSSTDSFLYESIVWNRTALKCEMRRWIANWISARHHEPARVLVYGDGLGFDSLYLSQAAHCVDYFEVSEACANFAKRMFADYERAPDMIRDPQDIAPAHYDVVVCLDVLEHVPEPSAIVQSLAAALRPGGHLIAHAPFWYLGRKVPTHLRSNRRFSGDVQRLYRPFDLELIDGCLFWNPIVLRKGGGDHRSSGEATRAGLRLRMGGYLLSLARIWALPHTLACEAALAMNKAAWPSLQRWAATCDRDIGDAR